MSWCTALLLGTQNIIRFSCPPTFHHPQLTGNRLQAYSVLMHFLKTNIHIQKRGKSHQLFYKMIGQLGIVMLMILLDLRLTMTMYGNIKQKRRNDSECLVWWIFVRIPDRNPGFILDLRRRPVRMGFHLQWTWFAIDFERELRRLNQLARMQAKSI